MMILRKLPCFLLCFVAAATLGGITDGANERQRRELFFGTNIDTMRERALSLYDTGHFSNSQWAIFPQLTFSCSGNVSSIWFVAKERHKNMGAKLHQLQVWRGTVFTETSNRRGKKSFNYSGRLTNSVNLSTVETDLMLARGDEKLYKITLQQPLQFDAGSVLGLRHFGRSELLVQYQNGGGLTYINHSNGLSTQPVSTLIWFRRPSDPLVTLEGTFCSSGLLSVDALKLYMNTTDSDKASSSITSIPPQDILFPSLNFSESGLLHKWVFAAKRNYNLQYSSSPVFQVWRWENRSQNRVIKVSETIISEANRTEFLNVYEYTVDPPLQVDAGDFIGVTLQKISLIFTDPEFPPQWVVGEGVEYGAAVGSYYIRQNGQRSLPLLGAAVQALPLPNTTESPPPISPQSSTFLHPTLPYSHPPSTTSPLPPSSSSSSSNVALLATVIILVLLGILLVLILSLIVFLLLWRRKKRKEKNSQNLNNPIYNLPDKETNELERYSIVPTPYLEPTLHRTAPTGGQNEVSLVPPTASSSTGNADYATPNNNLHIPHSTTPPSSTPSPYPTSPQPLLHHYHTLNDTQTPSEYEDPQIHRNYHTLAEAQPPPDYHTLTDTQTEYQEPHHNGNSTSKSPSGVLPAVNMYATVDDENPSHDYHVLDPAGGYSRLYQEGIYVPTEEQRKISEDDNHVFATLGETLYSYATVTKPAKNKSAENSLTFFEEEDVYWKPASSTSSLYAQLAQRKYREVSQKHIRLLYTLGKGQFGEVNKGVWQSPRGAMEVAVKTLKGGATEEDTVRFLQEAAIMGQFRHPNIVQLVGVVTLGEKTMIVLEYLSHGDLKTFLVNQRPIPGAHVPQGTEFSLLDFCKDIASGMEYLSRKAFVHRDLAARNILISKTNTCKIGDFGMSRDLLDEHYYVSKGGIVPIRWTAPEALNYNKYSTASDVWSFGVVMYEIWSLGHKPYDHYSNVQVQRMVDRDQRMAPPPGCPRGIYHLMMECWHPDHTLRPSFFDLLRALTKSPSKLLRWSFKDTRGLLQAQVLGGPLEASEKLFLDLQDVYTSNT